MHLRLWLFVAAALVGVLLQPRDALAQHAWESEILAYEAQDRTNPQPLGSVVITGSSTIQRWSTIRTDLAPLDVIPRGFGGSTTDDLDYYLERVVLVYQPRAVVIYSGDNDITNGRTAQYVADRIAGILARISARLPAARVYVISIKPSPYRWFQWPIQSAANQLLAAICAADARYTFINAAPAMLGSNGQPNPAYYIADGLHLSAAGYQVVTNIVRPVLLPQQLIPLPVDTVAPTTPTGVTATTQSKSRIDLRWNAAGDSGSGLAGYSVFRNGLRVGNTTTLGYSDTGLTSNTLYTYTVTAFDRMSPNRNESAQSASATATTLVDPTALPTVALQASPSSVAIGSSAQLSWTSSNASSCTASGGWSGAKGTSGTATSANLFANATFTLTCTGAAGGTASDSKSVSVIPAPTVSLTVSPSSVASGSATQLSWSSTDATSCTASGSWSGTKATSGNVTSGNLSSNASFTLCTGPSGTASDSKSVTILPAPTVSLTASPSSVASGSASQLSWNSSNATSCTASGSWSGTKATSGSAPSAKMSSTATFTLTCTGSGGTASDSKSVTVIPAPKVSLTASPSSVASGSTTQLSWTSDNATSCTASSGWSGPKPGSGSERSTALTSGATFTLTCTGPGGDATASAAVTVVAPPPPAPPTVSLRAEPTTIAYGGVAQLSWAGTNAASCSASGGWTGSRAQSGTEPTPALTSGTTFALTCSGPGGEASGSVNITVAPPPPPTATLTATPTNVDFNAATQLAWTSSNATSCAASGGWTGSRALSGSEASSSLTASTAFELVCSGPGGTANSLAQVTVTPPPVPSVTLSATPGTVTNGSTARLSWTTKDANDCAASGEWTGQKGTAGDEQTKALATESTFSLSCAGPGGSAYATIAIKVTAAPGFSEAPTPTVTATSGGGGMLGWWEVSGLLMLLIRKLRRTAAPLLRRRFTSADREVVDTVLVQ